MGIAFGRLLLAAALVSVLGCDDAEDRPSCTVHSCVDAGGDGDSDADTDADSDADADGDADALDCSDPDQDGHTAVGCEGGDDCAEGDPSIAPGSPETLCDGLDNDCDGEVDPGMLAGGTDVSVAPLDSSIVELQIAAGATGFGMLEMDADSEALAYALYFRPLGPDGAPVAREPMVLTPSPVYEPHGTTAIAAVEDGYLAVWAEGVEGDETLTLASIATDGSFTTSVVDELPLIQTPSLVVGGSTVLALWVGGTNSVRSVHFALLHASDLSPVLQGELSADPEYPEDLYPTAVWTGEHYVIGHMDGDPSAVIHVNVMDEEGLTSVVAGVPAGALTPGLGWNDFEGLLVYSINNDGFAHTMNGGGGLGLEALPLGRGVRPRIASIPRAFALARLGPNGDLNNYEGAVDFMLLGPTGALSNHLDPDDAAETGATFQAVMAIEDAGWAVAWIAGGRAAIKFDRITCQR